MPCSGSAASTVASHSRTVESARSRRWVCPWRSVSVVTTACCPPRAGRRQTPPAPKGPAARPQTRASLREVRKTVTFRKGDRRHLVAQTSDRQVHVLYRAYELHRRVGTPVVT